MPSKGGNPEEIVLGAIPPNTRFLSFPRSDGLGPSRWPPSSQRSGLVRIDGRLNYFLPLPLNDKTPVSWRLKVGAKVAEMMGKADADDYCLAGWPEGYEFFMHVTSKLDGTKRGDPYLYGSPHTAKFRSANEFIPHAYWLMTTTTLDKSECACRYCGGIKLQSDVNQAVLGAPARLTAQSRPPKSSLSPEKPAKTRPVSSSNSSVAPPYTSRSRNTARIREPKIVFPLDKRKEPPMDLYTSRNRYTELHEGRDFRDGEIVIIRLPHPIKSAEGVLIEFWPSWVADIEYRKHITRDIEGASFSVKEELFLVTKPLCAEEAIVKVPTSSVIPHRAWLISKELQTRLLQVRLPRDFKTSVSIPIFDPNDCMGKLLSTITFDLVAPYFALAVQTAAHMDIYWSPMYCIDAGSGPRSSGTLYQGLWWGTERIWLHDLARLTISHLELVSHDRLRNLLPVMEGSETRTLFMRIHQVAVVERVTPDGMVPVCQVSGPIFCTLRDPHFENRPGNVMSPEESLAFEALKTAEGNHFPLPRPPAGFKFVPVTFDNQEVTLELGQLAGRYYPKLFFNSCLDMFWIRDNSPQWYQSIAAMAGFTLGRHSAPDIQFLKWKRSEAAELSRKAARQDVMTEWGKIHKK
ncbi:hypothetical protein FRB91_008813 [Serendipita sp. 411]|nr:hypothetical protein FRB91_008813 [Serendipita sp. 411]